MKKTSILIIAVCFSFLAGCATTPTEDIKIVAEADPKAKFSGYKTYAWAGSVGILNDPQGRWKHPMFDVDTEINFLIDRELRKRGLSETSSKPELIVAYAMGVDMAALKIKEDPKTKKPILKNVPKGALLMVLVDARTGYVIWAGKASAKVQQSKDTKVMKARLDYAVTKLVSKIPK